MIAGTTRANAHRAKADRDARTVKITGDVVAD
jgi:hypothetical protein